MRLILLGPPGVGKGTQAATLAKQLEILHISCGDLLRQAVGQGTVLGRQAQVFMDKGELVPDRLVSQLVMERIAQPDAGKGFILDGFPRNISQARELDAALENKKINIDTVIYLDANQDVIIQRLSGRRLCAKCQANFHVKNMPPRIENVCDHCHGKLYQRGDDNEETIKNRLKVFTSSTLSLIGYYKEKKKLKHIIANEEASIVADRILESLNGQHKVS